MARLQRVSSWAQDWWLRYFAKRFGFRACTRAMRWSASHMQCHSQHAARSGSRTCKQGGRAGGQLCMHMCKAKPHHLLSEHLQTLVRVCQHSRCIPSCDGTDRYSAHDQHAMWRQLTTAEWGRTEVAGPVIVQGIQGGVAVVDCSRGAPAAGARAARQRRSDSKQVVTHSAGLSLHAPALKVIGLPAANQQGPLFFQLARLCICGCHDPPSP